MGQKKLIRFEELKGFDNVLQYPENMQGNWAAHFKNEQPIVLELACGKGEYAVGLALLSPQKNFIGVDIKGNRLWVGAKSARQKNIQNVAFLRTQIDAIDTYFAADEIEEIWITFPDPQLRFSKHKKRLTHPKFLRKYQQFLKPGGKIHLKTDSPNLYQFTKTVIAMYDCTVIADTHNLYNSDLYKDELTIKTHYEGLDIAQSNRIHYICFTLPKDIASVEIDQKLKEVLQHEID